MGVVTPAEPTYGGKLGPDYAGTVFQGRLNYRVDPAMLAATLPPPFRPKLYGGQGMVGICLIRLRAVRPGFMPSWVGISSENAAHRAAFEWDEGDQVHAGVYVRRRDTSSRLNALAGGRLFLGIKSHARFTVSEAAHISRWPFGVTSLSVVGDVTDGLPASSVFGSLEKASSFFQAGSMGYSATPDPRRFQGMELRCLRWEVEPLAVSSVQSSYFEDRSVFQAGAIVFDCALLMRGIEHEWHGKADLCCAAPAMPNQPLLQKPAACQVNGIAQVTGEASAVTAAE
ncbi:hypothetical protein GC170_22290 [bacterium]|nr:hypothetical protein [bacterium]